MFSMADLCGCFVFGSKTCAIFLQNVMCVRIFGALKIEYEKSGGS